MDFLYGYGKQAKACLSLKVNDNKREIIYCSFFFLIDTEKANVGVDTNPGGQDDQERVGGCETETSC